MLDTLIKQVTGDPNIRELKRLDPIVRQINALEPAVKGLSDEQLRGKTVEFRAGLKPVLERLEAEEKGRLRGEGRSKDARNDLQDALDELLPEAFAVVGEAGRRVL